jgi:hypothetical protein
VRLRRINEAVLDAFAIEESGASGASVLSRIKTGHSVLKGHDFSRAVKAQK